MDFEAAILEMKKGTYPPDANGTIRFTYGPVLGYQPRDAVQYLPQTTVKGVVEKDTGVFPFKVPAKVKDLWKAKDFGPYADARLRRRSGLLPEHDQRHRRQLRLADAQRQGRADRHHLRHDLRERHRRLLHHPRAAAVDQRRRPLRPLGDGQVLGRDPHRQGDGAGRNERAALRRSLGLAILVTAAACRQAPQGGRPDGRADQGRPSWTRSRAAGPARSSAARSAARRNSVSPGP
ncbi:MAG: S46 family peptidase [Desulfobacterales bacterium]|nr:S46 family peptidase [Desulfobacterales bacterium]